MRVYDFIISISCEHLHRLNQIDSPDQSINERNLAITVMVLFSVYQQHSLPVMCSSRKNPYPPHGRSLEIPRGRGVFIAKFLEALHENKLEFPGEGGEGGAKFKTFRGGSIGYFLELHNVTL